MGRIKAGNKTTKLQRFFKQPKSVEKQEVVLEKAPEQKSECPVVADYRARKYSMSVRKQLEEAKTQLMVADIKLGTFLEQKIQLQENKLLNEIDGSFQASSMLLNNLKETVDELSVKIDELRHEPTEQQNPEKIVVEKTVEINRVEEVTPFHIKVFMVGLVILNIILLLK